MIIFSIYRMATRFYSNVEYSNSARGNNDADVIYYNASIVNNNIANGDPKGFNGVGQYEDTQVVFNDVRQLPILQNASEYNMSVIRFELAGAGKSLPLFVPRIVPGQNDINLTVYNLYMSLVIAEQVSSVTTTRVYEAQAPIMWEPQYRTQNNTPSTANPQQQFGSDYYFCDSYKWWCQLVNATAQALQSDLLAQAVADGVPLPPNLEEAVTSSSVSGSPAPNLFYNPVTKLFSWSFDAQYWGSGYATSTLYTPPSSATQYRYGFRMGMDTNLETLLTNFLIFYNDSQTLGGFPPNVNEIIVTPQQIAIDTDPTTGQAYTNPNDGGHVRYVITQDYESISGNWSPIDSVVITTTKLPITPEVVAPAPGTFGNSDNGFNSGTTGAAFQSVIGDVQCGKGGAQEWRQYIEYMPNAEYKMMSLGRSQEPINNIDMLLWWRCRYDNNLYPLRLYNGSAVSVKIMFRRKGF